MSILLLGNFNRHCDKYSDQQIYDEDSSTPLIVEGILNAASAGKEYGPC